ncbi:Tetratricopeptide repeat,Tetratricopeptide repeat-containing domain,Tetratricopeptide-like helical [Cinara cedri]|uniref:Cell division cycle protein 27 homolog n=1 Tax=Cinara cedri TaxID=506608 RepID=A0A5E4M553_9HEMI|nr:Tetratricopeptide repeat,Tetratricopeptide repeat-containing domain,Tetratricopeptide-like helical [Cinara cedri]
MDVLFKKYSNSGDPISVVLDTLPKNESYKFQKMLKKLKLSGRHKVKDLIEAIDVKASTISYNELNKYFSVIKIYESLHELPQKYQERAEVLNNIGAVYFQKNDFQEACNNYHLAVCKKTDFVDCWISYILVFIKKNDVANAIRSLNMILHYRPNLCKPYLIYGYLLIKMNEIEKAILSFQRAIKLEPKWHLSWIGLGNSYALKNNLHSAIICYEKALTIKDSAIDPLINLGFIHYQLKQFDESIFYLKTAIHKLYPEINVDLLHLLGHAYYNSGNIVSAMKTSFLCLKCYPKI